jgi:hypothetical protein
MPSQSCITLRARQAIPLVLARPLSMRSNRTVLIRRLAFSIMLNRISQTPEPRASLAEWSVPRLGLSFVHDRG